jgi:uncharacterized membrane protein YGL010W
MVLKHSIFYYKFDAMQSLNQLLDIYGESHKNGTNKVIHWICVPSIMFSLTGLLMAIPFPIGETKSLIMNWGFVVFVFAWLYYLRLSTVMFVCFLAIGGAMLWGNLNLLHYFNSESGLAICSIIIFAAAWIGQFIGHAIEGKKPSFLQDLQFLLIGPAWLLHFVFDRYKIKY